MVCTEHFTLSKILNVCLMCALISSCSYQYLDENGNHNVVGLVNVTTQTNQRSQTCQVDLIEVTTIGISGLNLPSHGSFSLGYSKNSSKIITTRSGVVDNKPKGIDND